MKYNPNRLDGVAIVVALLGLALAAVGASKMF